MRTKTSDTENLFETLSVMTILIFSASFSLGMSSLRGRDGWLVLLSAILICVPFVWMIARTLDIGESDCLKCIRKSVFLKNIFSSAFFVYFFTSLITSLSLVTHFVTITILSRAEPIFVTLACALFCCLCASIGKSGILSWGRFMLVPVLLAALAVILLLTPVYDFHQILPFEFKGVPHTAALALQPLSCVFLDGVITLFFLGSAPGKKKYCRSFFVIFLFSGTILLALVLFNLFALGYPTVSSLYFPFFSAQNLISIGYFFQHAEVFFSSFFLVALYFKISLSLFICCRLLGDIFRVPHPKKLILPLGLLGSAAANAFFPHIQTLFAFLNISFIFALPLQTGAPFILWVLSEIDRMRQKRRLENKEAD